MTATIDDAAAFSLGQARRHRLVRGARYALVLMVWAGLFVIRPRLALEILRERRSDSPLPRRRP